MLWQICKETMLHCTSILRQLVKPSLKPSLAPVKAASFEDVAIIVLHYHTPDILRECLRRLVAYAPLATIIVVDTDLQAETQAWLEQTYPHITLLASDNHSMAHGINTGLTYALSLGKPYLCHMNADVYIQHDTFSQVIPYLQLPNVGIVAPRAYNLAGETQKQGFLYNMHYWRLAFSSAFLANASAAVDVAWLSGCIQCFSRDFVLAMGGLDSSLRFCNEDMDWCLRAKRQGWRCLLLEASVVHLGGSSTPSHPAFFVEGLRGGYKLSQRYHSKLYQWGHRWSIVLWALVMAAYAGVSSSQQDSSPQEKAKYQHIARKFYRGEFDISPFTDALSNCDDFVL